MTRGTMKTHTYLVQFRNALVVSIEEWCLVAIQADVACLVTGRNIVTDCDDLNLAINVAINDNSLSDVGKDSICIYGIYVADSERTQDKSATTAHNVVRKGRDLCFCRNHRCHCIHWL